MRESIHKKEKARHHDMTMTDRLFFLFSIHTFYHSHQIDFTMDSVRFDSISS